MARNLALDLTAAYDTALAQFDVLVMPTLPIVASLIPLRLDFDGHCHTALLGWPGDCRGCPDRSVGPAPGLRLRLVSRRAAGDHRSRDRRRRRARADADRRRQIALLSDPRSRAVRHRRRHLAADRAHAGPG